MTLLTDLSSEHDVHLVGIVLSVLHQLILEEEVYPHQVVETTSAFLLEVRGREEGGVDDVRNVVGGVGLDVGADCVLDEGVG